MKINVHLNDFIYNKTIYTTLTQTQLIKSDPTSNSEKREQEPKEPPYHSEFPTLAHLRFHISNTCHSTL